MTDNTNKAVITGGDQFSSTNDQKTKPPTIPMRYMVAGLVLFCTFNLYMCRINLSTAIVVMSKYNKSSGSAGSDICATSVDKNSTKSHNSGDFDWDESTQGVILGAFFYGYLVFQVLGGRLAEIFGAKWLCAVGIGMSIVVNALTPIIARTNIYWLLLASRVVLGMFQAFIFPSCYALFSKWAPDHERSTFLSFPTIGGNIGTIATTSLSGYLAEYGFAGGWPSVFYVSAMIARVTNYPDFIGIIPISHILRSVPTRVSSGP